MDAPALLPVSAKQELALLLHKEYNDGNKQIQRMLRLGSTVEGAMFPQKFWQHSQRDKKKATYVPSNGGHTASGQKSATYVPSNGQPRVPGQQSTIPVPATALPAKLTASAILASCVETPSEEPVTGVKLSDSEIELIEGQTHNLTATVLPESATDKALEWKTSNSDVATVDENGYVTAVSAGNATVSVLCWAKEARCELTVKKIQVDGVSVQPSSYTLAEGETLQLSASISPAEGTDPGENLLEAKDTTYPSIAADSYSGDVFILSSKYITSNKQDVMLFQNGVLLFSSSFRSAFDPYCIIE